VEHLTLFDTYLGNVEQDDSRKIYLAKHVLSLAEGAPRQNPKSEYRNPKQTQSQLNLKTEKSKTLNPKEAYLEFDLFWSFEFVSNFGFRASKFLFSASLQET